MYAKDTSVSVEKSRSELEAVLRRYGASAFGYIADDARVMIQFRAEGRTIRFVLPVPSASEKRFTHWRHNSGQLIERTADAARMNWEQECRSAWRALLLSVKTKLEAVERKIATFEEEFMARIVLPDGSTVGEQMLPRIAESYRTQTMPSFTLALPASSQP